MLQLDNDTPFAAERAILLDLHGEELWTVIVKATFGFNDGIAVLADHQEPIAIAPEYNGEPGVSSLKYETDMALMKPGTDVLLNGQVYAPGGRPATSAQARMRVGPIDKQIRVYGDRIWTNGIRGVQPSNAQPFDHIPVLYERSFGGTDPVQGGEAGYEERNPVGVGFAVRSRNLLGTAAPNFEDPVDPKRPIGLGALSSSWQPRRGWLGTCDGAWQAERMPLYPVDIDQRFFQTAPQDQVATGYLHGGELVELENFTPNGRLSFRLPRVALGFVTLLGSALVRHRANLDTVILEPEKGRVLLTWRTHVSCHRRKLDVKWTRIYEKELV